MRSNHTPGPWQVGWQGHAAHEVYNDRGLFVCSVVRNEANPHEIQEANAELIADAPRLQDENGTLKEVNATLLAALRDISEGYHADTCGSLLVEGYECSCHVRRAREAIESVSTDTQ